MTNNHLYVTIYVIILYKGAFNLKKIYFAVIAAIMAAVIPMQVMAQTSQLSVSNERGEVKLDVNKDINRVSADIIFDDIDTCTEMVSNKITLKSDVAAEVSLRLGASELPGDGTNPLDNYKLTVTDSSNKVIYNSEASPIEGSVTYREISLGEIAAGGTKIYTVAYELIDDSIDMSMVKMEVGAIATSTPTTKPTVAPTAKPTTTLKPKFELDNANATSEFVFDFDSEFADEDGDNKTGADNKTKEIKKVCGKDIPAGRFGVSGNGQLKITSANGSQKSEYIINEKPSKPAEVKDAVVVLEEGDVITIKAVDGQEKAKLKFDKVATDTAKTTATPVKADDKKNNPKTGDSNMGIIIGIGVFAVLAVAGLELLKRKGRTNN